MLKTIATFGSNIEAELIRGKFETYGIESFISKDDCGGMRPHMQLTDGVQLKVSDADFEKAKDILTIKDEDEGQIEIEEDDGSIKIKHLLHRARGWILVGFAIIPGWISFPISLIYSTLAYRHFNKSCIKDDSMKNRILRIQFASAFFTVLYWSATICYITGEGN